MNKISQPSKEEVRHWLKQQVESRKVPDPHEVRRALGWGLVESNRVHHKEKF
jgi:hypothetical protein